MKAMMPELELVRGLRDEVLVEDFLQETHAHGYHGTKLLALVDGDVPHNLPREESQDDIHDVRVDCARVSNASSQVPDNLPLVKFWYRSMVTVVQQVPSTSENHSFLIGQQRVHMIVADTPSTMLTEMMMN